MPDFGLDESILRATWGVYSIVNLRTGQQYIGSTTDSFLRRWKTHYFALQGGKHDVKPLQWDWTFQGCQAFEFRAIEPYTGRALTLFERLDDWARHREAVHLAGAQNLYNRKLSAASLVRGDDARKNATRYWNAFYGTNHPVYLCAPFERPDWDGPIPSWHAERVARLRAAEATTPPDAN